VCVYIYNYIYIFEVIYFLKSFSDNHLSCVIVWQVLPQSFKSIHCSQTFTVLLVAISHCFANQKQLHRLRRNGLKTEIHSVRAQIHRTEWHCYLMVMFISPDWSRATKEITNARQLIFTALIQLVENLQFYVSLLFFTYFNFIHLLLIFSVFFFTVR